jgi:hypothetical protein
MARRDRVGRDDVVYVCNLEPAARGHGPEGPFNGAASWPRYTPAE